MASDAAQKKKTEKQQTNTDAKAQNASGNTAGDPAVQIYVPKTKIDFVTIIGLSSAIGLIIFAISMGSGNAQFINGPAIMIVVFGTMAATSVAYSGEELKKAFGIIGNSLFRPIRNHKRMAIQLMDIAMLARKKGLLALATAEKELRKDPFLARAVQLVTDGYSGEDIDRVLGQEVDSLIDRHKRSASMLRRASEVAPAMGLIGTLVGLVQMLAELENPAAIGPAMAVALLTTFYGAIMGTVVLGPLAAKLDRNSSDEAMTRSLILLAMGSIARQENPRRLEMLLNSELPPSKRIRYFD